VKKLISVMMPCYNEAENVEQAYREVRRIFEKLPQYDYEHIFIDNASTDQTVDILKRLAAEDRRLKIIVNTRNFGHIRSPYHGILQAGGAAVICLASDLQEPPSLIPEFLKWWEQGFKMVRGVKSQSEESALMFAIRKMYYNFVNRVSDIKLLKNSTGFGLYDRCVIEELRKIDDPYPYFRGLVSDIGFPSREIEYMQPTRKRGISKNNFYTLYDIAMLGITNHSKVPLRLATMLGFAMAIASFLIAMGYLVAKLIFWDQFSLGTAPLIIGLFFLGSVQLFFIGIIGEYIGAIYTQVQKRPLVVEKERINFD
jgi:glycosyltransferase involved in cell wall biosynthesis